MFQASEFFSFLVDPNAFGAAQLNTASENQESYAEKFRLWVEETSAGFFVMDEAGIRWVTSQEFQLQKLAAANKIKSDEVKTYWLTSIDATVREANERAKEWIGVGEHYGDGLAEGLRRRVSTVRDAAALLAGEAIFTSRNVGGVKSPSTVMRQIGAYYGEGLALGLRDSIDMTSLAAGDLARSALPAMGSFTSDPGSDNSGGSGAITINANGTDPMVVTQMIKHELRDLLIRVN